MNMNKKKTQRTIAAVIAVILILCMVVPLIAGVVGY